MMQNVTIMRSARFALAVLAAVLLFPGPVRADAGADLAQIVKDYREGLSSLRAAVDPERGNGALDMYDSAETENYLAARRQLVAHLQARLEALPRAELNSSDRLSYEILLWDVGDEAAELKPGIAERFMLLPLNQFNGRQLGFAREMQWRADVPFSASRDYDRSIRRMIAFTRWVDSTIARLREGIAQDVTLPRIVVERMIAEIDPLIAGDAGASLFLKPLERIPESIGEKERVRVDEAYREAVGGELMPSYRKLRNFLEEEYLPNAREAPGLWAMPGGREMYLYLVRSQTTEDLSPDAIHALGLAELARIEARMEEVKRETGFTGSLEAFRQFLRTDPRFKFKDNAAMLAEFNRVKNAVLDRLDAVIARKPRADLTFRFYESFAAPVRPAAEYSASSANGRRPGVVYLNAFDLSSRPTYTSEALALHEGIPGHHLQVALAAENQRLPQFRRFGFTTAFTEGWGLYAESLGPELGLYTDPYQKFGSLTFDAWRAARLVVDTGVHWLGWSREKAIAFMLAHTVLSENEAAEEVERYIAIPGQALAYKIGEQKFLELRARAKKRLGDKFDLRRFHEAVLEDGAMPLPILDAKIDRWIDAEEARGQTTGLP